MIAKQAIPKQGLNLLALVFIFAHTSFFIISDLLGIKYYQSLCLLLSFN